MNRPANALLAVTADRINLHGFFGQGADFGCGRFGAVTVIDYRTDDDGTHHPIAYLPSGPRIAGDAISAVAKAWLAGDRQPWTEAQTGEFLERLKKEGEP